MLKFRSLLPAVGGHYMAVKTWRSRVATRARRQGQRWRAGGLP